MAILYSLRPRTRCIPRLRADRQLHSRSNSLYGEGSRSDQLHENQGFHLVTLGKFDPKDLN